MTRRSGKTALQEAASKKPEPKTIAHEMRYDAHGPHGPGVYCTCGARKIHNRGKVLIAWITKHTTKTGHKFVPPS